MRSKICGVTIDGKTCFQQMGHEGEHDQATVYQYHCETCGTDYASNDDPIKHNMTICFDKAFDQRIAPHIKTVEETFERANNRMHELQDALEQKLNVVRLIEDEGKHWNERVGQLREERDLMIVRVGNVETRMDAKSSVIERLESGLKSATATIEKIRAKDAWLEQVNAQQLTAFTAALESNARKVGEAISLQVQYDALKAEHSKCASVVNSKRVAELESRLLATQQLNTQLNERVRELQQERDALADRAVELADQISDLESSEDEDEDSETEESFTLDDVRDVIREELRKRKVR